MMQRQRQELARPRKELRSVDPDTDVKRGCLVTSKSGLDVYLGQLQDCLPTA